jgi:hypothetical protein
VDPRHAKRRPVCLVRDAFEVIEVAKAKLRMSGGTKRGSLLKGKPDPHLYRERFIEVAQRKVP